jgi:hypothetical protein
VLLISTHANPIGFFCKPCDEVTHWNGPIREKIPNFPMLIKCTTFKTGIDVVDQLQAL